MHLEHLMDFHRLYKVRMQLMSSLGSYFMVFSDSDQSCASNFRTAVHSKMKFQKAVTVWLVVTFILLSKDAGKAQGDLLTVLLQMRGVAGQGMIFTDLQPTSRRSFG